MIKKITVLAMATVMLLMQGCGSGSMKMRADTAVSNDRVSTGYDMGGTADAVEAGGAQDAALENGAEEAAQEEAAEVQSNQKLIITQELTVETKEFDTLLSDVKAQVGKLGGYIENSEISGSADSGRRYASLKIRVPAKKTNDFISVVEQGGTVIYNSTSTEDITLHYVDTESHLKALKVEEESLLNLLEKATKLSDIFEIQRELTEVRYQIESCESQLRVYDNQVDYSTIHVTVNEVDRETSVEKKGFWPEAGARFFDNLYAVGQGLRGFALWLIGSLPVLVFYAILIACIVFLCKRVVRRRGSRKGRKFSGKKKQESGEEPPLSEKENSLSGEENQSAGNGE